MALKQESGRVSQQDINEQILGIYAQLAPQIENKSVCVHCMCELEALLQASRFKTLSEMLDNVGKDGTGQELIQAVREKEQTAIVQWGYKARLNKHFGADFKMSDTLTLAATHDSDPIYYPS